MTDRIEVVVVGAGQAGLAVSHELTNEGVDHVVLERDRMGQSWRGRWDSFCLVTPNWFVQLPGHHYDGSDPDGFMPRDEIVAYLERYAAGFEAPVREGIEATSLGPGPEGGFLLETSGGEILAGTVVLSTGAYQRPHRPGSDHASTGSASDRRRGLPQPGGTAGGPRAGLRGSPAGSVAGTCRGGRSRRGSST